MGKLISSAQFEHIISDVLEDDTQVKKIALNLDIDNLEVIEPSEGEKADQYNSYKKLLQWNIRSTQKQIKFLQQQTIKFPKDSYWKLSLKEQEEHLVKLNHLYDAYLIELNKAKGSRRADTDPMQRQKVVDEFTKHGLPATQLTAGYDEGREFKDYKKLSDSLLKALDAFKKHVQATWYDVPQNLKEVKGININILREFKELEPDLEKEIQKAHSKGV